MCDEKTVEYLRDLIAEKHELEQMESGGSRKAIVTKLLEQGKTVVEEEQKGSWPQLMIFPEGSTSNRRALMTFAPGAFNPGKTVQPVVLR